MITRRDIKVQSTMYKKLKSLSSCNKNIVDDMKLPDLVFAEYFEAEQHVDDEIQHDHVRAGPGGLQLPTSQHTGPRC